MKRLSTPKETGVLLANLEYSGPSNDDWSPSEEQVLAGRDYYLGLAPQPNGTELEVHVIVEHEGLGTGYRWRWGKLVDVVDFSETAKWRHHYTAYFCEREVNGGRVLDSIYEGTSLEALVARLVQTPIDWKPPFVAWWVASGRSLRT